MKTMYCYSIQQEREVEHSMTCVSLLFVLSILKTSFVSVLLNVLRHKAHRRRILVFQTGCEYVKWF